MKVGDTVTLRASLEGVKFSSDNESVITVTNEGLVTAISVGKATVTCVLEQKAKSNKPSPKLAKCICKVNNLTADPTSITIEKGKKEKIEAKVETAELDADKKVKFSSENVNVATVDEEGEITAVDVGQTVITLENNGMKATCAVEVIAPITFEVTLNNIFAVNANFTITPSSNDITYAVGCLTKTKYDAEKAKGDAKDPPLGIFSYDRSWYEYLASFEPGGATWQEVADKNEYYKEGAYTTNVLGGEYINLEDLKPETPCVIY